MGRVILTAALLAAVSTGAPAQDSAPANPLLTRPGWEVGGQFAHYQYEEPNFAKLTGYRGGVVGAYNFVNASRVYNRIDLRGSYGGLKYESLDTGTASDVPDWIAEARAVIGKDFLASDSVVLSPYIGLGFRYLYSDGRGYTSTGEIGYRRYSHYVYTPVGVTLRMRTGGQWVIAPTLEYDAFLGGKQYSKLSDKGLGLSNASNSQKNGRGYRASFMVEKEHWSFGPWLQYWNIKDSDIVPVAVGVGAMEPANWTREYGVEVRYRF